MKARTNKLLAVLLVAILCIGLLPVSAAAADAVELKVSSAEGKVGDIVDLEFTLEANPGIVSLVFQLNYDSSAIELVEQDEIDEETGEPTGEKIIMVDTGLMIGDFVPSEKPTDNPYTLQWVAGTSKKNCTKTGVVATFKAKILKPGVSDLKITFDTANIFDKDMAEVAMTTIDGTVSGVEAYSI